MVRVTKERVDRRVRELEGNINGKQQAYNNRKQEVDKLPIGLEYEADYQRRRGKSGLMICKEYSKTQRADGNL